MKTSTKEFDFLKIHSIRLSNFGETLMQLEIQLIRV